MPFFLIRITSNKADNAKESSSQMREVGCLQAISLLCYKALANTREHACACYNKKSTKYHYAPVAPVIQIN